MRSLPSRRSGRALIALIALAACAPGFQIKRYHTNPDLYQAAYQEYTRKKWDNAIAGFERLTLDLSARDTLLARAHWYLAMAHEQRGDHLLAATSFLRLAELFPDDTLADRALLSAGNAYARLWRSPGLDPQYGTLAQMQYRLLESIYPDSPLREKARQGAQQVDEWLAEKEYETAQHYGRRHAWDSALISYKFVVKEYPNTQRVRDSLMRMVEVYRRPELKYIEEARETCGTLRAAYPADAEIMKLCGAPTANTDSASTAAAAASAKPKKVP
ncbi:MAG TPA: outer membrane protein assembly factor BamD [Gemmatimonadaceae bacterium]|nr:outer membrane protein assembly factor BamD [Gemmatimonadaceae bacterium]